MTATLLRMPSRFVTPDRDNRDTDCVQVRENTQSRSAYLDNGPPLRVPHLEKLTELTDKLCELLSPWTQLASLFCTTLTARPGTPIAPLLASWPPRTLAGWMVVEATSNGAEHAHGLVLAEDRETVDALVAAHWQLHGLDPSAQRCLPLSQWRTRDMRRGVYQWVRYALATDRYLEKRTRPAWEAPVAGFSWGVLADTDVLSRFAYADRDALARHAGARATVTPTPCGCGCGDSVPTGRRAYASDRCAARHRQRRHRARLANGTAT